ncbi:unnamed protein product [Fructobacillus evanidus]|uniref:XkdX family protein n=1 Tax=Fructobacillus evanidus TaxID=3064281 RepID=A0ABM9N1Z7_9LACO|nr:MAG: hypothetical protein [Caudoviricetes sp.]CAK1223799.1 unnamed protein product [Fructobacillus sp. LMG 32999]CAK1248363.1 unnamed protein product [Fructobacillus sp. LMG 32999]CAK1249178.1 unnamed protein product [Fructobacillus sp. LMG 32999]CAK1254324.1 unnamed protein product [Fructobacillus sp. LMG 32999]
MSEMFEFVQSMYPKYWDRSAIQLAVEIHWVTQEEASRILSGKIGG